MRIKKFITGGTKRLFWGICLPWESAEEKEGEKVIKNLCNNA